jgi:hypothetical protein
MGGRPLTTGEGNKPRQFHIRREHLLEGSALDVDPPFASLDVVPWRDYEAECGRLREQLDAARQALEAILSTGAGEWNLLEVHRIARAALLTEGLPARAALGVEGPQPDQGSAPTENVGRARDEEPS